MVVSDLCVQYRFDAKVNGLSRKAFSGFLQRFGIDIAVQRVVQCCPAVNFRFGPKTECFIGRVTIFVLILGKMLVSYCFAGYKLQL